MSTSGAGRGRGWLNLAKNSEAPRPMGFSKPLTNNSPPSPPIANEYMGLIDKIKELNVSDDGIMFNQKMHYIQSYWSQTCDNKNEVELSFMDLYYACLHDSELASKLVILVASRSFISQEIHGCNIRHQFLKHLQNDIENSNQLQTASPMKFRNCVHMLGEFYSKGRLSNGETFSILAAPFLSCLDLLLSSKSLPDLILFTTQLFLNGTSLRNTEPEELFKLSIKIRTLLIMETHLVREAKLWLLLAIDLFNVKFTVLSPEVHKFYEDQLGSSAMLNFQRPQDVLSIQTVHTSKVLDSYQSNVNVLQISTSPNETNKNEVHKSQFGGVTENCSVQQPNNCFPKDALGSKSEKPGRPILGAGARFIKKSNEENGTWNHKQNSNSGRSHNKKKPPPSVKNNKGWEHDDRFENDYN